MHTFEIICWLPKKQYQYLHENLPSLQQVTPYVERTNYYMAKGITQIELITYEYPKNGMMLQHHYLVLRCNPSIIMGDSKIKLVDLEKYTSSEILNRLQKRLYEINEFRFIRLDKLPVTIFLAREVHIAVDIVHECPQLIVWLCNMSFPYHYQRMKRTEIKKTSDVLFAESCCFHNGSRAVNFYYKLIALINTGKKIEPQEYEEIKNIIRLEIQLEKQGIYNMKLPTKRSLEPFLNNDFCHDYIAKEVRSMSGIQKYVSRSKAVEIINNSQYKAYDKAVMLSIIDIIPKFKGLYELEKAIDDKAVHTPPQYGNLRSFKERWLRKFKKLGIQPVVIPDSIGIDEVPSIYELLTKESEDLI